MSESFDEALKKQLGNDIKRISLNDTINVGCDNCGNCCMKTQVRLNAFDIYNMFKHMSIKDFFKNTTMYFGNSSKLPMIMINDDKINCPFLKANNNGDFLCTLENDKPMTCNSPFIAIITPIKEDKISFVPLDQKITDKIDIEEYLISHRIEKSDLVLLEGDNKKSCKCKKSNIKVSDYLETRIKYQDEYNIANLVSLLAMKYIKVDELLKIILLSETSSINILDMFKGDDDDKKSYCDKIRYTLYKISYFYVDPDKDFMEQSLKHLDHLQSTVYPTLRILYKYLYKVIDPSEVILKNIIETEDLKDAQNKFNNYYAENISVISNRFTMEMKNMIKEMEEIKS